MDTCILRMAISLGSTRPGRNGEAVARRVYNTAKKHNSSNNGTSNAELMQLPLSSSNMWISKIIIYHYWINLFYLRKDAIPKQGLQKVILLMLIFLSQQNTITEFQMHQRMQSIIYIKNGITRLQDLSARAAQEAYVQLSIYA